MVKRKRNGNGQQNSQTTPPPASIKPVDSELHSRVQEHSTHIAVLQEKARAADVKLDSQRTMVDHLMKKVQSNSEQVVKSNKEMVESNNEMLSGINQKFWWVITFLIGAGMSTVFVLLKYAIDH